MKNLKNNKIKSIYRPDSPPEEPPKPSMPKPKPPKPEPVED